MVSKRNAKEIRFGITRAKQVFTRERTRPEYTLYGYRGNTILLWQKAYDHTYEKLIGIKRTRYYG